MTPVLLSAVKLTLLRRHSLLLTCYFCKQVTKRNESYEEHKRNAEHPNWKQVASLSVLQSLPFIDTYLQL